MYEIVLESWNAGNPNDQDPPPPIDTCEGFTAGVWKVAEAREYAVRESERQMCLKQQDEHSACTVPENVNRTQQRFFMMLWNMYAQAHDCAVMVMHEGQVDLNAMMKVVMFSKRLE